MTEGGSARHSRTPRRAPRRPARRVTLLSRHRGGRVSVPAIRHDRSGGVGRGIRGARDDAAQMKESEPMRRAIGAGSSTPLDSVYAGPGLRWTSSPCPQVDRCGASASESSAQRARHFGTRARVGGMSPFRSSLRWTRVQQSCGLGGPDEVREARSAALRHDARADARWWSAAGW